MAWLSVPIVVNPGAETTEAPKAVSVKTEFVLILIPLPDAKSVSYTHLRAHETV